MAPKAKPKAKGAAAPRVRAKAKAKAKARVRLVPAVGPLAMRRLRAMRRPGAVVDPDASPEEKWDKGETVALVNVPLERLGKGQEIVIQEGTYFTAPCKVAGTIVGLEVDHGTAYLRMKLCGTDHDGILRQHSGSPGGEFRVHRCPDDCHGDATANDLIHGSKARLLLTVDKEEGWTRNLEKVMPADPGDDLAVLRAREVPLAGAEGGAAPKSREEVKDDGKDKDKKSDKDQKKKKKKKKAKRSSGGEEKSTEQVALDGSQPRLAAVKPYNDLFRGTGLDAKERIRARVARRARKVLRQTWR